MLSFFDKTPILPNDFPFFLDYHSNCMKPTSLLKKNLLPIFSTTLRRRFSVAWQDFALSLEDSTDNLKRRVSRRSSNRKSSASVTQAGGLGARPEENGIYKAVDRKESVGSELR